MYAPIAIAIQFHPHCATHHDIHHGHQHLVDDGSSSFSRRCHAEPNAIARLYAQAARTVSTRPHHQQQARLDAFAVRGANPRPDTGPQLQIPPIHRSSRCRRHLSWHVGNPPPMAPVSRPRCIRQTVHDQQARICTGRWIHLCCRPGRARRFGVARVSRNAKADRARVRVCPPEQGRGSVGIMAVQFGRHVCQEGGKGGARKECEG
ncbi:hypothetical protein BCR44DRAFT_1428581 [Catenaria anguillulae PL171]|uniref:Uncharacterized protein n=1 Tax=Catenaria anguillulae PL171 TaxID=765915 RepID=A0A1Y2HVG8_9FUNG|nr:hypothetical protein BCR44DRAFT_1428581 [Catenaria anguillulae PL171]